MNNGESKFDALCSTEQVKVQMHHESILEAVNYLNSVKVKLNGLFADIIGQDSEVYEKNEKLNASLYEVLERSPDMIRDNANTMSDTINAIRSHLFNS